MVVFPDPELRDLRKKRDGFVTSGVAVNTKRTRSFQLARYKKFCKQFNFNTFPCSPSQASLYASYLSDMLKPVSIRNYLSAVWYFQKLYGYEDHSTNFMYKNTLNGIEREYRGVSVVRYPLKVTDLLKMRSLLNMDVYLDRLYWLGLLLAFRGVLRISHIVESSHSLHVNDITVEKEYVKIHVRTSKTDQFGRNPHDIYLKRSDVSLLCPALLLLEICVESRRYGCKLFAVRGSVLTYSYFNTRLKLLSISIGLPISNVSTHSLRHGGATFLKKLGLSTLDIMKKANWRSNVVYKYLHDTKNELLDLDFLPKNVYPTDF